MRPRPVVLIILDGWGVAPPGPGNAIAAANTPFYDELLATYPNTLLACHGLAVGLPEGQMGNSEVGHLNLGAGRVVYQDITRINKAIEEGRLATNPAIADAFERVKASAGALHLMGLVSDGGVHSLQKHLEALVEAAAQAGVERIFIHAFLDGRDTPPDSGADYLEELERFLSAYPNARIATVMGRYYAMDRDRRWERVEKAWDAIVRGKGRTATDPVKAVREAYEREEYDEFVQPIVIVDASGRPVGQVRDGDAVIFFNFRADRARELTWAFVQPDFNGFDVSDRPKLAAYVCMTSYDENLDVPVAFPPEEIINTLAEVLSNLGLKQLHIAETEKYAHVTFFFNGGREEPFPGEDRVLIPSPKDVPTYDKKPEMSAPGITEEVLRRIDSGKYDFIVMNYANGDMVGHTGVFEAAKAAAEAVDRCLAKVVPEVLKVGGKVLLTADHGNAEQMIDPNTGGPWTAHSISNPVPCILIDPERTSAKMHEGALCDVAPTVLWMMGLDQPAEMTGRCLVEEE